MRKIIFYFAILFILTSCDNLRAKKIDRYEQKKELTGNIKTDLTILLPNSEVEVDIMDGIYQSPRQIELTKKFQIAIQENQEWFYEFIKTVPQGETLPYDEKLGLTKEEYLEMKDFMENIELASTGKEKIKIEVKDSIVRFEANGKLTKLNSLSINTKNNTVNFEQYKLAYSDTTNIITDKNPLRSKWKGYKWKFEEPENVNFENITDLSNLDIKEYTLTIGRLEKNGKTYLRLKGRETKNGMKTIDINMPIEF